MDLKGQLERAAALKGLSLSSFVVRSMEKVAAEIIAEYEHRQLTLEEQQSFFDALMNPPQPNEKMLAAARRYHET